MELYTFVIAALLIEAVVNLVKTIKEKSTDWKYWAALGVSLVVSIIVSYNWNLDLFSAVLGEGNIPYIGAVLTALIIARGSNIVSDLVDLIKAIKVRNGG